MDCLFGYMYVILLQMDMVCNFDACISKMRIVIWGVCCTHATATINAVIAVCMLLLLLLCGRSNIISTIIYILQHVIIVTDFLLTLSLSYKYSAATVCVDVQCRHVMYYCYRAFIAVTSYVYYCQNGTSVIFLYYILLC